MNITGMLLAVLGVVAGLFIYRFALNRHLQKGNSLATYEVVMAVVTSLGIGLIPLAIYEKYMGWHERVPLALGAAGLDGKQWSMDDYRLASQITIRRLEKMQPALEDAVERQDFGGAMAVADTAMQTIQTWNDQQDEKLKQRYAPCRLAQTQYLAIALESAGRESQVTRAYKANLSVCKELAGW